MAEEKIKAAKHLKVCQNRVRHAEEAVASVQLGLSIVESEVEECEKAAEESSRSRPSTTLFDPLLSPHWPRVDAAKGGRKPDGGSAGHAGQGGGRRRL